MFPWTYGLIIATVSALILIAIAIKIAHFVKETEKGIIDPLPQTRVFRSTTISSPLALAVFRLLAFLYTAAVLASFLALNGISQLRFYTVWNYTLVTAFFGIAAFVSWVEVAHHLRFGSYRSSAITPITWVGQLVQIGYELSLPMTILVTVAQWSVLLPLAYKEGKDQAYLDSDFFNFWGYNMHGVNVVLIFVEFLLNVIPMDPIDACYLIIWPCAYAIVTFILNATLGGWPYTIVNTGTPTSPVWYLGLFVAHVLLFFFWTGLSKLKLTMSCAREQVEEIVLNWGTKTLNYDQDERSRLLVKSKGEQYEWGTKQLYGEYQI